MVRAQISLDDEVFAEAQRLADQQGISFAELCRRVLSRTVQERRYEERYEENPWLVFAGVRRARDGKAIATDGGAAAPQAPLRAVYNNGSKK